MVFLSPDPHVSIIRATAHRIDLDSKTRRFGQVDLGIRVQPDAVEWKVAPEVEGSSDIRTGDGPPASNCYPPPWRTEKSTPSNFIGASF
jgi:hypothetical protein